MLSVRGFHPVASPATRNVSDPAILFKPVRAVLQEWLEAEKKTEKV